MKYSDILFLSGQDTSAFLLKDQDHYIRSLSEYDLIARQASNYEQYASRSAASAVSFTQAEMLRLSACCRAVDIALRNRLVHVDEAVSWINVQATSDIPWKLGITRDTTYEGGLPHTRADVIFLCRNRISNMKDLDLQVVLLHEKIHVYQRLYKKEFEYSVRSHGYRKFCKRKSLCMARSNPDLDEYVYCDKHGNILTALYARDTPTGITDVIYTSPTNEEHPNEVCAYTVSRWLSLE